MEHATVHDIMSAERLVTIEPSERVDRAKQLANDSGISHLLVVSNTRLEGVVCLCDFDSARVGSSVGECMHRRPLTTQASTDVADAVQIMNEAGVSCLPVLIGQTVVGVLTRSDLRRAGVDSDKLGIDPHCASCGGSRHVRVHDSMEGVGFCLDCRRQSEPPHWTEDLGGGSG